MGWKDCGALEGELETEEVMCGKTPTIEILERLWLLRHGQATMGGRG